MQESVENFSFDQFYPKEFRAGKHLYHVPKEGENPKIISKDERTLKDCISRTYCIYEHRALNVVVSYFGVNPQDINPCQVFRFDCRVINDIITFRAGADKKNHYLVAACGDGYLRVFNISTMVMIKAVKGYAGKPTCIDIAKNEGSGANSGIGSETRDLIAVGFDDDSFIVYSMI